MKRWLLTVGVLASLTGVAAAAPGDPRTVEGTLEWPATLEGNRFIIVRTDDGRAVYVNVTDARRAAPGDITAGSRISVLGVEGFQPHEVVAARVGPRDSAIIGGDVVPGPSVSASPRTDAAPAAPAQPSETLWRLRGTVQSISGSSLVLRPDSGGTQTVNIANLSQATRAALRRGDEITLFGPVQKSGPLVASGFVQSEPMPAASLRTEPAPAASPRMDQYQQK